MRPLGGRSAPFAALVAAAACASGHERFLEPVICAAPVISRSVVSADSVNVLSALVTVSASVADSVLVQFGVAALDSATPALAVHDDSVRVPVLGIVAATTYEARVIAVNRCGTTVGEPLVFTTGPLPADLPHYTASGNDPAAGYVVFAGGMYGLVIDNTGRVVWYHRFPNGPGLDFQPQPNGRYVARPGAGAGAVASWIELAPDGSVTRTLGCARDLQPRMHDMIGEPDGSYWLLCDEVRTLDLSSQGALPQTRVMGTAVQHRSAAGDLLFEWSPFDHLAVDLSILDSLDRYAPVVNWTHGNSLDLDSHGDLLVSYRNLNEVIKIDTRTGAIIWRMGGAQNTITFENTAMPAFTHQHGLRVVGAGQVMVLDNLGESAGSRAERYEVDDARRSARLLDAYGSSARLVAQVGGSTQALPGGNVLVSFGSGGGLQEYDAAGNLVWKLTGNTGYIFRAERIRSLYQPGVGDPR